MKDVQDYFNEALEYAAPFIECEHMAADYAAHATYHASAYWLFD
jgi:hypothetical protein